MAINYKITLKLSNGEEVDATFAMPEPVAAPAEVTVDSSLGVTGAAVGQVACVTAVDENGVPTAWGVTDMTVAADGNEVAY